jgi:phosphonopyruvate decarboxylase
MIKRDDMIRALTERLPDDQIVVAAYTAAFDLIAIRPNPLNYISSGAMGLTSSHALGFALAMPDRRIILLDGDGSLLMNLGCLVTIAEAAPRNLIHFVCQNGTYEANGGHPIPGQDRVDFAAMAKGAGYAHTHEISDLADFNDRIDGILAEDGPVFVDLKLEPGEKSPRDYSVMHGTKIREDFRAALKAL